MILTREMLSTEQKNHLLDRLVVLAKNFQEEQFNIFKISSFFYLLPSQKAVVLKLESVHFFHFNLHNDP